MSDKENIEAANPAKFKPLIRTAIIALLALLVVLIMISILFLCVYFPALHIFTYFGFGVVQSKKFSLLIFSLFLLASLVVVAYRSNKRRNK